MDCLGRAVRKLDDSEATFVAVRGDWSHVSFDRGINPIMKLLEEDIDSLRGACVADKVIGKAAALLLCYAGIERLYARTISTHAVRVLRDADIAFEYGHTVPFIVNRSGDGMCPMEQLVLHISLPEEAYAVLKKEATG